MIGRNLKEACSWLNHPDNSYHKVVILEALKAATT
jgi:hypothetical protein